MEIFKECEFTEEDIIVEILIRLPIKNLLQLKLVSKQWLSLITGHTFAFRRAQFHTSSQYSILVLEILTRSFVYPISWMPKQTESFSPWKVTMKPRLLLPHSGSKYTDCHLHVLFPAGYGIYCLFETLSGNVLLWNPTIKDTKVLPLSPYYPSHIVHAFYFGTIYFKDGTFSYKVGRIFSTYMDRSKRLYNLSLDMYSSETKCWKTIPNFSSGQYMGYDWYCFHSVILNRKIHWVIHSHTEDTCITTFDYETEVFGKIKAPSSLEACHPYFKGKSFVTLLDDKFLCLVMFRSGDGDICYIDIWVMREYAVEDSWIKEFTIGPIDKNKEVLGFSSKLRGVFLCRKNYYPAKLLLMDCNSLKWSRELIGFGQRAGEFAMQVVDHAESILCVSTM